MSIPFEVRIRSSDGVTTVALHGELDLATVGQFHRTMVCARSLPAVEVVIDAQRLTFIDGCGLRALTTEAEGLRRGRRRVRTINLSGSAAHLARLLHAEAQLGVTCDRPAVP